ncbi:type IV secretion system protein VirB10 [Asticcacaulis sp. W401b]|uniref:type IV secretion system protein VirB10 n=1 Tax=Asticcacaulis sp. W401b TaxID=3388666 RepID=UPI0039705ADC
MTPDNDLGIPPSQPQPDDIVSVNARTAPGGNPLGKVIFLTAVAAAIVVGMAVVLNMAKGNAKPDEVAASSASKSASGPARRTFETPPPLPGAQAQASMSNPSDLCADGLAPIAVRGSNGAPVVTPNGPVLVCRDGTVPVTDDTTYVEAPPPPPPPSSSSQSTYAASAPRTASITKRVDPYAGDVFLSSGRSRLAPRAESGDDFPVLFATEGEGNASVAPLAASANDRMLASALQTTRTAKVRATKLGDRNLILPKGKTIECGLSVRLVSDLAGQASCVLTQNVYSDNGRVVLLERGSEAVGEYRATMERGQRRLFVIWTRIKTPNGIIIELNSPGADGLGGAGLPGHVDNHWWQRVGSAFLLSTIQDAIVYAASRNDNGDTIVLQNTQSAGRQMADRVLENSINIKPTLYKNQGDRGLIYVARDLDFGDVYAVQSR